MKPRARLVLLLSVLSLAACGDDDGDDEGKGVPGGSMTAADPSCASGTRWAGGNEESALMHPGGACISCHEKEGEGPLFRVAGTVYAASAEQLGCFGASGAQVVISADDGQSVSLETNTAGNFMYEGALAFPLSVKVVQGGKENAMASPVTNGDCNSCHEAGSGPGRIVLP